MQTITWPGDTAIQFEGECLGFGTSDPDSTKPRWTEISLYRTAGGTYLIAGTGVSDVEGEVDVPWLNVQRAAKDVIRALARRDKRTGTTYLTNVARDVLTAAAKNDPEIADAFTAFSSALDLLRA